MRGRVLLLMLSAMAFWMLVMLIIVVGVRGFARVIPGTSKPAPL